MAARLGNVVYWLSLAITILAGLLALLMFFFWYNDVPAPPPVNSLEAFKNAEAFREVEFRNALQLASVSVGSYLIGRIARYILLGVRDHLLPRRATWLVETGEPAE